MRERRIGIAVALCAIVLLAMRHPSADIRILTHDATDRAPMRVQAAVDLGLMAFSVLITWTKRLV